MADNSLNSMAIQVELPDPQTMQKHLRAINPHPQYVLIDGLKDTTKIHVSIGDLNGVKVDEETVLANMVLAFNGAYWTPTDINTLISVYPATESYSGTVFLATSVDIANNVNGSLATTPRSVYLYCTSTFSPLHHTHSFTSNDITNKPFVTEITTNNYFKVDAIVTPAALVGYSAKIVHPHSISDINSLQITLDGKSNVDHTHSFSDIHEDVNQENETLEPRNLQTVLDTKADINHQHDTSSIVDYITGLYFLNMTDPTKLPFDNILDCPPGYMKFPINNTNNQGKLDYAIVEWGYINVGVSENSTNDSIESIYEALNAVQYPTMNVVLHVGFTMLNTEVADTNGNSKINGIDADIQLKSILRDNTETYVRGFQYYLQVMKDPAFGHFKFLWWMIGLDNKMQGSNAKYSLVLERGISKLAACDGTVVVDFVRPAGEELSTETVGLGLTIGSRSNDALSVPQLDTFTETKKVGNVSVPGSFVWLLQDIADTNTASRNGRVDWMRLGINRYSFNSTIAAQKGGNWVKPFADTDIGYTNYLEIPLNSAKYHQDKCYIAIPLSTTDSNIANKELIIEWGTTSETIDKKAFSQVLNSKVDTNEKMFNYDIKFIDFTGKAMRDKNNNFIDESNWEAQYVKKTDDGFLYYPQLLTSNAHNIKFSWTAFAIRDITTNGVTSVGTIESFENDDTKTLIRIPLTFSSIRQDLVIEFGTLNQNKAGTYSIYVDEKLPQILHTAMTFTNVTETMYYDVGTELYFGASNSASTTEETNAFSQAAVGENRTAIQYKYTILRSAGKPSTGTAKWMVIGLTEEVLLRGV